MTRKACNPVRNIKTFLKCGAAAFLLAGAAVVLVPTDIAQAQEAQRPIEETNRYHMRLMMQIFDGSQEFSHTQTAGFARMRRGDESWVMVNFGDGAVVVDDPSGMKLGRFRNTSGTEAGLRYNYATKTLAGNSAVAAYHNSYVRPLLGKGPELSLDATWNQDLQLGNLGLNGLSGQKATVAIERRYFMHDGKPLVLIHYRLPSFSYTSSGKTIVQWGEGFALTDPGFGNMYWNAALHRAVSQEADGSTRPYRVSKSMVAIDTKGKPLLNLRKVAEAAPYLNRFFGKSNKEVMGFAGKGDADQLPVLLATRLDIVALSLAEDSANQLGELTGSYTEGPRGNEQGIPIPAEIYAGSDAQQSAQNMGAQNYTSGSTQAGSGGSPGLTTAAHEQSHQVQAGGGGSAGASSASSQTGSIGGAVTATATTRSGSDEEPRVYTGAGAQQNADAMGAQNATSGSGGSSSSPASGVNAHEQTHQVQNGGASGGSQPPQSTSGGEASVTVMPQGGGGGGSGAGGGTGSGGGSGGSGSGGEYVENVNTTVGYADKLMAILGGSNAVIDPEMIQIVTRIDVLASESAALQSKITASVESLRGAQLRLEQSAKYVPELNAVGKSLTQNVTKAVANAEFAQEAINIARAEGVPVTDVMRATLADATLKVANAEDALNAALKSGDAITLLPDATTKALIDQVKIAAKNVEAAENNLVNYAARGTEISRDIKAMPRGKFATMIDWLDNSSAGRVLAGISHSLNALTIANSVVNTGTAATSNQGSGQLPLTRNYDGNNMLIALGLDLLGLAGNALSGNVPGFLSDASAITLGSVTDILISVKGLVDVQFIINDAKAEGYRQAAYAAKRERERYVEESNRRRAEHEAEMARLDREIAQLDSTDARARELNRQMLEELRARREERKRQADLERKNQEKRAAAEEFVRQKKEQMRREPTEAEWAQFHRDIEIALRPKYPTVAPPTPEEIAERERKREEERQLELARAEAEAAAIAAAAAEAERARLAEEERKLEAALAAIARREAEAEAQRQRREEQRKRELELSELETSELEVSELGSGPVVFDPVVFNPPVWVPPVFTPPVWVPPEFVPPEPSEIEFTEFDDDDFPGSVENLAYQYENLTGKVVTDLGRWKEWLATQDIRKLERLALQAGYPNLASALADAENIIRQSQDEGYRRWAMQAPSCGGYVGCGPSYLERWAMKQSIVVLGDILNDSRGIFSSGGFSDVGISGLNLSYLLRDHGIQDGDIVQITISQFGRDIYKGRLSLTNDGDLFNLQLRKGVASLTILAENEGTARPNTAQIRVNDVVRGEATQTYSLSAGQTATLRIESNAKGN